MEWCRIRQWPARVYVLCCNVGSSTSVRNYTLGRPKRHRTRPRPANPKAAHSRSLPSSPHSACLPASPPLSFPPPAPPQRRGGRPVPSFFFRFAASPVREPIPVPTDGCTPLEFRDLVFACRAHAQLNRSDVGKGRNRTSIVIWC